MSDQSTITDGRLIRCSEGELAALIRMTEGNRSHVEASFGGGGIYGPDWAVIELARMRGIDVSDYDS